MISNINRAINRAFRFLRQNPLHVAAAVASLGLGIGFSTAIFACVKGVLLTPLPGVAASGDLVTVWREDAEGDLSALSYPDFKDLERGVTRLSGLAAYSMTTVGVSRYGKPERRWGMLVSANFFDVLGVKASRGRLLDAQDETAPGANPVVVLSYGYWQKVFGGDPAVIGRDIGINKRTYTIVGVADADFQGPYTGLSFSLYIPVTMRDVLDPERKVLGARTSGWLTLMGRRARGATAKAASLELTVLAQRLDSQPKDSARRSRMSAYSLPDSPVGTQAAMGPVLLALSGVAAFVLLLVCLNIASLMLVRSGARRREVAIRMALGATRIDLARQFLSESMLLALLGGICGVVAAQAAVKAVPSLAPTIGVPLALDFPIDWAALTVNFAVAVAAGFACALLPAYQASRIEPASVLREEGGSIAGSRRHARWRDALSVSQIALSFTLLVCAGLFLRSVQRAERIDLGFNPRDVHLASIDLASSSYTREAGERFYQRLRERLKGLPGVKSVALAHTVPLGFGGNDRAEFLPAGYQAKPGETMTAWLNSITPDYFATMGVPLLRGRGFAETDTESSPRVAIINETLANRYWPGADAVGRRFSTAGAQVEVVGVAKDYYTSSLKRSNLPYFYVPLAQSYQPRTTIHVRSGEAPRAVAAAIERAVSLGDPELAVSDEETLEAHVRGATFAQHLASVLLAVFGLVALYLTILGVYGTLAQMVKNRVKEIGIRIALGATPGGIRNMVLKRALFLGAAGAAIGCALSSAAAVMASGLLIGVRPLDFISIGTAGVLIITTTMAAAYFPARRAARQDPAESIRRD